MAFYLKLSEAIFSNWLTMMLVPENAKSLRSHSDVTKLVAAGYDQIADSYLQQFGQSAVRPRKLNELADLLPSRAHVLDLGCGAGVPVARDLIARGFEVTGVDASARQIERARGNVPQARFILADMTTIEFPAFDFDAVAAFYSITHIPRDRHASLLAHLSFEAVIFGNHIAEPPHRLGSDFDLGVRTIECGDRLGQALPRRVGHRVGGRLRLRRRSAETDRAMPPSGQWLNSEPCHIGRQCGVGARAGARCSKKKIEFRRSAVALRAIRGPQFRSGQPESFRAARHWARWWQRSTPTWSNGSPFNWKVQFAAPF